MQIPYNLSRYHDNSYHPWSKQSKSYFFNNTSNDDDNDYDDGSNYSFLVSHKLAKLYTFLFLNHLGNESKADGLKNGTVRCNTKKKKI